MDSYQIDNLSITVEKQGAREYSKVSYPIRYGCFSEINRRFERIEVTANFVLSDDLPLNHFASLSELVSNKSAFVPCKGGIYLSPLMDRQEKSGTQRRKLLKKFHEVKTHTSLPTFLYLIQRL
jgi:hypothetical protein